MKEEINLVNIFKINSINFNIIEYNNLESNKKIKIPDITDKLGIILIRYIPIQLVVDSLRSAFNIDKELELSSSFFINIITYISK